MTRIWPNRMRNYTIFVTYIYSPINEQKMKKLTYLAITAAALTIAACTGENKNGYVITGSVEGAADGDTVYLQEANGRELVKIDTAIIRNGTFTFKGQQDSAVNRYLTCQVKDQPLLMDFFLENGKIKVALGKENDSATGTPSNDAYQEIREKIDGIGKKTNEIFNMLSDTLLTDEQREAKLKEAAQLEVEYSAALKEAVKKNIGNAVGIHLFKRTFYENSIDENDALLQQIPANFQNDEAIVKIKEMTEKQKRTAVGTKFIDFEMKTPEGKAVKLSDYAGKGKVVLVDFWASWCGPCRREMPNLVEAYAKYKGKKFEIVGVSLDQDAEAWKESIKSLKMTWPQMSDLKLWQNEGAQLYAVNSIPHTVLIDGEGTIIARGLHGDGLAEKLAEIIK
ncbi:disulfide interchange protein [Bacteroides pyogenes JCM 6292]|uniref:Disulfide interchange protein n=3 Tax=Bacteroides pyogenes TaxID=310300 RepID=W4PML0_9BACE|nr:disulfide interchange protein [Bacteroides pyogenes JCM 6292]GAE20369.1 disulfide interchange protein [Bacteroides pyogenes DSM 20611 = JCM 6294]